VALEEALARETELRDRMEAREAELDRIKTESEQTVSAHDISS
jgi:hypothetical protein